MQIEKQLTANLDAAVLAVMEDIEVIGKNKTIGTGANAYKGVSDIDVKVAVRRSMIKNKLVCYPIEVSPTVDHIYHEQQIGATAVYKEKVFTSVRAKYKIKHVPTGEFEVVEGYGHGVDSQDKSAGKAATYAMKSMLLYLFMIPTGELPDADDDHENDIDSKTTTTSKPVKTTPKTETKKPEADPVKKDPAPETKPDPIGTAQPQSEPEKPTSTGKKRLGDKAMEQALERVSKGEPGLITNLSSMFELTDEQLDRLRAAMPKLKATLPGE